MHITLITVGNPKGCYQDLFAEYTKRLSRFVAVSVEHIKENKDTEQKIIQKTGKSFCVLLDEHGTVFSSQELAYFLDKKALHGASNISFVIGGADGHTSAVRARADFVWSLSPLTFPHELAAVLLAESLYRALSISAGHPYHRT